MDWPATDAKGYVATLMPKESFLTRTYNDIPTSNVTCDLDNSCFTTFFNLDSHTQYSLFVHKQGYDISVTQQDIKPLSHMGKP